MTWRCCALPTRITPGSPSRSKPSPSATRPGAWSPCSKAATPSPRSAAAPSSTSKSSPASTKKRGQDPFLEKGVGSLPRRLAVRGGAKVVGELIDERRQHRFPRIGVAHAAAHALLGGDAHAADLAPRLCGAAPNARAGRRFDETRRDLALHVGAHTAFELGEIRELHIDRRLGVGELADEHRGDAVLLADLLERARVELPGADRS